MGVELVWPSPPGPKLCLQSQRRLRLYFAAASAEPSDRPLELLSSQPLVYQMCQSGGQGKRASEKKYSVPFHGFAILPIFGVNGCFFSFFFFSLVDALACIPAGIGCFLIKSLFVCRTGLVFPVRWFFLEQLLSKAEGAWQMVGCHGWVVLPHSGAADAPRHLLLGEAIPAQQESANKISRGETPMACFHFNRGGVSKLVWEKGWKWKIWRVVLTTPQSLLIWISLLHMPLFQKRLLYAAGTSLVLKHWKLWYHRLLRNQRFQQARL